jgi:hypothetical protein
MIRSAALLTLGILLGAASPLSSGSTFSSLTSPPDATTPPADPGLEPAPVPNLDAGPPVVGGGDSAAPRVRPDLFSPQQQQFTGNGFVSGSTAQGERDERMHPGAGFSITMPMQEGPIH